MKQHALKRHLGAALAAAILGVNLPSGAVELPSQPYLPLAMATKLVEQALGSCSDQGYRVSVAVVDAAGVLRAQLRANGAGPHTLESSRKKAYTAASLGESTAELAGLVKRMPEAAGLREMGAEILILGGGLPLKVQGETVGGIGVGGAPGAHLDEACAQAAIDAVLGKKR